MKRLLFPFLLLIVFHGFSQETTPLITAIKSNNLAQVKTLVAAGADVNEVDGFYNSSLKVAIENGNLSIVKFLVESDAKDRGNISDAVQKNNIKLTKYLIQEKFCIGEAIVYAAENNNLEMVKLLASNGAKVNFSQKRRKGLLRKYYVSPIDKAMSHNNLAMVKVLMQYGLPPETAIESSLDYGKNDITLELSKGLEDKGWLLIEAFSRSNDPLVDKLIAQGVPTNSEDDEGNTMLLIAASKGDLTSLTKCVEEYNLYILKKNNLGENALMKASRRSSRPLCAYLLENGITVDAQNNKGETALFYALGDDSRSVFDFLIEKGANINHQSLDGNTLLTKAAIQGKKNAMIYLLSLGADVHHINKENKSAFHYIVADARGYSPDENEIQNTFIQAGANINTGGNSGETLLFAAVERGKFDRVVELVSLGANANTLDINGERPDCREPEIIKFLIEKGADINATDSWDNTFMCEAIKRNDLELAHYLADHGIDINKRCYFDEQAIIKAIKEDNITLVQFLAENGADVNAVGYMRKNVMDYALKEGNTEIISYLRSRGAMTKEERNEQYKISMKLESEIKSALIAEDLEAVISLMSKHDVIILQEKVVQDIAYVAAKLGNTQMMNKLLSDDIDFDVDSPVNNSGQTALFIAAIYSQNDLVLDLLAKGANVNYSDKNGKNAVDYASRKSTEKIFKNWSKID